MPRVADGGGILTKSPAGITFPRGSQKDNAISARVVREIISPSYRLRKLMRGRFYYTNSIRERIVTLRETTKRMIALLEQRSGSLVHVIEDPDLPVISKIILARGDMPMHIITYKPGIKNKAPDYSIIFQCAMSIRMFECPPDDRMLIAGSAEGLKHIEDLLVRDNDSHYSNIPLDELCSRFLMLMVTHLRSVPLSLRVSQYLSVDHPELLEQEIAQAEWELQIHKDSLADHVRATVPAEIFNINQSINTAFALFWAERLERPELSNPYYLAGFEHQGKELLRIFSQVSSDPLNDYELIDQWAEYLRIRSWYQWLPYAAPY